MINFPSITTVNSSIATSVQAQPQAQAQVASTQSPVVDFSRFAQTSNSTAAMKAQVAASDINFNQNFYNSIQYLNAQAAVGIHHQVDGKIAFSTDVFAMNQETQKVSDSSLINRLDNIDNLAKDRNGSNSLLYTRTDAKKQEQRHSVQNESKLKNIYA